MLDSDHSLACAGIWPVTQAWLGWCLAWAQPGHLTSGPCLTWAYARFGFDSGDARLGLDSGAPGSCLTRAGCWRGLDSEFSWLWPAPDSVLARTVRSGLTRGSRFLTRACTWLCPVLDIDLSQDVALLVPMLDSGQCLTRPWLGRRLAWDGDFIFEIGDFWGLSAYFISKPTQMQSCRREYPFHLPYFRPCSWLFWPVLDLSVSRRNFFGSVQLRRVRRKEHPTRLFPHCLRVCSALLHSSPSPPSSLPSLSSTASNWLTSVLRINATVLHGAGDFLRSRSFLHCRRPPAGNSDIAVLLRCTWVDCGMLLCLAMPELIVVDHDVHLWWFIPPSKFDCFVYLNVSTARDGRRLWCLFCPHTCRLCWLVAYTSFQSTRAERGP